VVDEKSVPTDRNESVEPREEKIEKGLFSYRLEQLAYARSGDKGNNCNIGEFMQAIICENY